MAQESQRLTPGERANLVAYIDGELNEAEARAIATKLSLSPTARREVEVLERTWEMLEHLPRPKASELFTERTLTEVRQIAVKGDHLETAFIQTAARLTRALGWVAGAAVAFVIGFILVQRVWPNPTARLARDLSIAGTSR